MRKKKIYSKFFATTRCLSFGFRNLKDVKKYKEKSYQNLEVIFFLKIKTTIHFYLILF